MAASFVTRSPRPPSSKAMEEKAGTSEPHLRRNLEQLALRRSRRQSPFSARKVAAASAEPPPIPSQLQMFSSAIGAPLSFRAEFCWSARSRFQHQIVFVAESAFYRTGRYLQRQPGRRA